MLVPKACCPWRISACSSPLSRSSLLSFFLSTANLFVTSCLACWSSLGLACVFTPKPDFRPEMLEALLRWLLVGVDLGMKEGVKGDGCMDCRLDGRLGVARGAGEAGRMLANGFGPKPLGCGIRLPVGLNVGVSGCCGDRGLA